MKKVNIPAIMGVAPAALRRHLVVNLLLGVFPDSHDQWIELNQLESSSGGLGTDLLAIHRTLIVKTAA